MNLCRHAGFSLVVASLLAVVASPAPGEASEGVSPNDDASAQIAAATDAAEDAAGSDDPERIDVARLGSIIEEHAGDQLDGGIAPGMVVVAVDDDGTIFSEGFGDTDIRHDTSVDPSTTLVDIGSMTTSMTAVATMRTAEDQRVDLDEDIASYIQDFALGAFEGPPITLRHLLDQSAGFSESTMGVATSGSADTISLAETLDDYLPSRVRSPGEEFLPSRHAVALAGYLIETSRDTEFTQVLHDTVFGPLDMEQTASIAGPRFQQVVDDAAVGHSGTTGRLQPQRRLGTRIPPADGVYTTADNMGRFLDFLISGDSDVVDDVYRRQLFETSFRPHPDVAGTTAGFREFHYNNKRWLVQPGESPRGFSSLLLFCPDKNFGFFVGYNSDHGAAVRFELAEAILDEFFGAESSGQPAVVENAEHRVEELTGRFHHNRTVTSGPMKPLGLLLALRTEISPHGEDQKAVEMSFPMDFIDPVVWHPVQDDLWKNDDQSSTMTVHRGEHRRIEAISFDEPLLQTFHRSSWHQSNLLIGGLLVAFVFLFLIGCVVWPGRTLTRRLRGKKPDDLVVQRRKWLAVLYSVLTIGFFFGYGVIAGRQIFGLPDWAPAVFAIPVVLLLLCPLVAWCAIKTYRQGRGSSLFRGFYYVLAAGALTLPPVLYWWDLPIWP